MKCLLIVAVALLLPLYVRYAVPAGWIRFVVNTLLCESVSIAMMYAFGMTLSERQKVLSVIKKKSVACVVKARQQRLTNKRMFSVSKRETECLKQQPADSYLLVRVLRL